MTLASSLAPSLPRWSAWSTTDRSTWHASTTATVPLIFVPGAPGHVLVASCSSGVPAWPAEVPMAYAGPAPAPRRDVTDEDRMLEGTVR